MHSAKKAVLKRLSMIILSSFFIVSCGDQSTKTTQKSESKEVAKETPTKLSIDNNETKKYNQYVKFYNTGLNDITKHLNDYFRNAGEAQSLQQGKGYTSGSSYRDWENIKSIINEKPVIKEMDDAATQLIPLAEELDGLLDAARKYYKAKDYVDDKYAKGKELHTKILANSEKFKTAYKKFNMAIKNKEFEVRTAEMEQAKKDGNKLVYNRILVFNLMDKIMNELDRQNISASNVLSTDLSKIKPLYEEFSQAQKTLREIIDDKLSKDKDLANKYAFANYAETTTEFKVAVIDLIERVETKKPVSQAELHIGYAIPSKGTPEQLEKVREKAIDSYNRSL